MDRQLAERMVGAACLLAVLVLIVPAILDGNPDSGSTITHPVVEDTLDLRTHTIRLDGSEREPPVPTPVESRAVVAPPAAGPAAPADEAPPVATTPPDLAARTPTEPTTATTPESAKPTPGPHIESKAPTGTGDWIVQLGSFSSRDNADRLAASLRRQGFAVTVLGGGGSSGTLFRVRAGPEPDKAAADELASRLTAAGFKGGRVGLK
ncbi:MAG: SPOR domain-containing protein [Gammaproteobacteria bacterium]